MYLIALCDDERTELKKTRKMLDAYQKRRPETEFRMQSFEDADALLEQIREEAYRPDLILLDIYMPQKPGMEAAKELRRMGNTSKIIFLTTSREHALEAFGVDAVQYLVKPVSEEQLFPILDRLLEKVKEERKKYLVLRIQGRIRRVAVNDIVYCEAQGKQQCLYLVDDSRLLLRMTMGEIYGMLSGYPEFVKAGATYILNLEYVDNMNAQDICFHNGKKIYPPRGSYKTLKEQYFSYYCEGGVEESFYKIKQNITSILHGLESGVRSEGFWHPIFAGYFYIIKKKIQKRTPRSMVWRRKGEWEIVMHMSVSVHGIRMRTGR